MQIENNLFAPLTVNLSEATAEAMKDGGEGLILELDASEEGILAVSGENASFIILERQDPHIRSVQAHALNSGGVVRARQGEAIPPNTKVTVSGGKIVAADDGDDIVGRKLGKTAGAENDIVPLQPFLGGKA